MASTSLGYTKNEIISNVQSSIGNTSTALRNYLRTKFHWLESLICGKCDWRFTHQTVSFNTVASTQAYDLDVASVGYDVSDIEIMYDTTNGREIHKNYAKVIVKVDPKEDDEGEPNHFAYWEDKKVYLYKIPDDTYAIKAKVKVRPIFTTTWSESEYPLVTKEYQGVLQQALEAVGKKYSKHTDWKEDWFLFEAALRLAIEDELNQLQAIDRVKDPREELGTTSEYNDLNDEIWRQF